MTNYDFDEIALTKTIDFTAFLKMNCIRIPPSARTGKGCQSASFFVCFMFNTGIKNRRGYEDIISNLSEEDNISVVFCDANGLKTVNDNLGHASGDEFVCIIKGMKDEQFRKKTQDFGDVLKNEGKIVAFGYETGFGDQILNIVKAAEKMMYSDKERYYLETGKDRRR